MERKRKARFDPEAYRDWQDKAELEELERLARYHRVIIERSDPECERAITALEAGWRVERDRNSGR